MFLAIAHGHSAGCASKNYVHDFPQGHFLTYTALGTRQAGRFQEKVIGLKPFRFFSYF